MFQILAYINYWFHQVDEHSLHSPFLFSFYQELVKPRFDPNPDIEQLRAQLRKDSTLIELIDYGAGSRVNKSNKRKIATVAKHSTTPLKFSLFLQQMIRHFKYENVWELGTSLGLNTLYLSENEATQVTTFEGDPTLCEISGGHFSQFKRKNIKQVSGDLDETLSKALETSLPIDMVYIDANHRYEPTISYYHQLLPKMSSKGVIVFDDIHWSKEMQKAWIYIQKDANSLTIDLFEGGLLFLDPELPKENWLLTF